MNQDLFTSLKNKRLGHQKQADSLKKSLLDNRLAHSFCFSGPQGIGKKRVALELIRYDFCTNSTLEKEEGKFSCPECQRLEPGNHPDFLFLEPENHRIKIDQVRQLIREAHFRPFFAPRRWVLVDQAECLTEQAQNAFLRTLEEPPEHTHFILITHALERLLTTVRSRCQITRFYPLDPLQALEVLKMAGLEEEEALALNPLAPGCPGKALQWSQDDILELRKEVLTILCKNPHLDNPNQRRWNLLLLAQKLGGHKNQLELILDIMRSFYRDLVFYELGVSETNLINQDFFQELSFLKKISFESIHHSYQMLSKIGTDFKVNTNPELAFNWAFNEMDGMDHV